MDGSRGSTVRTVVLGAGLVAALLVGALVFSSVGRPAQEVPTVDVTELGEAITGGLDAGGLATRPDPPAREPLPDATLPGFADGPPVQLSGYRGTPLVVNFWATWCAPCVAEMPDLQAVATDLAGRVAFLGINHQDAPSNAATFVAELGITYDLASDPDGSYLEEQIGGFGMPTTLLVDPAGTIVHRHTGPLTESELRQLLADQLDVVMPQAPGASSATPPPSPTGQPPGPAR